MIKKLFAIITLFSFWHMPGAQPVTFTYHGDRLNPVSGFTAYSDCAVDMNDDQLDDVVRVGNKGMYIDYQQPDGLYSQKFFPLLIQAPPSWSICAGDIDNNGYNDLLFGNSTSVSFVQSNENGNSYEEKVMPSFIFSQRSTFADIDNDGWLDAFVCNDTTQSIPYKNQGSGNMAEDTNLIHTANRPGNYAAIWTDYDNDGDIDLYITKCEVGAFPGNINRTNLMYSNNGDGTYTEVGAEAGLDDNAQSWSTVFEDFDNDGDFDAFIVNHDFQNRFFRNNGNGTFTDIIGATGIDANDLGAYENASGDFNNDGNMDIFAELKNELYLGNGDLTFTGQDAPIKSGAIADLNNDGFLDVFHSNQLWLNERNENHWLKVVPLGIEGNRNGIGARVECYGAWGLQVREVRSGQSYSPMSSLTVHFGLGQSEQVDSVIIRWPSGIVTTLENPQADSTYFIPEAICLLSTSDITFNGKISLCPGDTIELNAPPGFLEHKWSNGKTGFSIAVHDEGSFFAISTDSNGCVSLSSRIDISLIQEKLPEVFSAEGNTACEGDSLMLTASPGDTYMWSTGATGTQSIVVYESGSYTVATDALCFQGQLVSEPFNVMVLPSPPPIVNDVVILPGDSVLLSAEGENCEWYDQVIGGNLLASGPAFQTMPLNGTATYYVESHHLYPGVVQSGGKLDTTGIGGPSSQAGYLKFTSWEPFTLISVTVYAVPGGPLGPRFVQLWSGDSLLAVKRFELQPGANIFELNFNVPVGTFSLQCQQGNLWRNTGELNYPYPIGDAGQITSSSFGNGYYYYFYDWKIQTADVECVSPRSAVNVIVSGTKEWDTPNSISLYPNPTSGKLWIAFEEQLSGSILLRVYDSQGKKVLQKYSNPESPLLADLSSLPSGVYQIQVLGDVFFKISGLLKL